MNVKFFFTKKGEKRYFLFGSSVAHLQKISFSTICDPTSFEPNYKIQSQKGFKLYKESENGKSIVF